MSTRATLTISDEQDSFDIYRHHDGYPDGQHGVMKDLKAAQNNAWTLPRFEAGDFAAATVAQMKQSSGSVYLTKEASCHSDRAFHYEVKFVAGEIQIVVQDFTKRIDGVISKFMGTIDEAVHHFNADGCCDGESDFEHETLAIPVEGIDIITSALDAAALDINQSCKWRPDADSTQVLRQILMAKAIIDGTE